MGMVDLQPLRGRCSHCHSKLIQPLKDGWICTECGQTGVPPECEAGCILRWNGILEGDCRAPSNKWCYMYKCDAELYKNK